MANRSKPSLKKKGAPAPAVGIIMGSQSDWATMQACAHMLDALGVGYETRIVSAHRTPDRMAAYLPGMVASMTTLPVLGVPVESRALKGLDSLLSIAQMPGGVPVASFAIGEAGAKNAALHAAAILGLLDAGVKKRLDAWRTKQTKSVAKTPK
jgi:5-(carboxyamino)imidazole ribonucleotide mutase